MTKIDEMRRYIELTSVTYSDSTPYRMTMAEVFELRDLAKTSPIDALDLAFDYGRAKGERHARAEWRT